ncbi:aspartyl beta-hydroxylase [Mycobacteroides abscessus]
MKFDPSRLQTALAGIPTSAWSLASTYTQTRVHHGYRRVGLVSARQMQKHAELFQFVWDALDPIWDAWLSWIEPGGFIIAHRDAGPWRERWQVPISAAGQWRAQETFAPKSGEAFPVTHWEPHAVVNRTDAPRIHLVIDRDIHVNRPALPFETFPIPADMADLIERSQQ